MDFNYSIGKKSPARRSPEFDVRVDEKAPPIQAQGNLSFHQFLDLIDVMWSDGHPDITFTAQATDVATSPQRGYIVYSEELKRAVNSNPKPRHRVTIDDPTTPGIKWAIYTQDFTHLIRFTAYHKNARVAEEIIEEFESFMLIMTPELIGAGAQHIFFDSRTPGKEDNRVGQDMSSRSVTYSVTLQKVAKIESAELQKVIHSMTLFTGSELTDPSSGLSPYLFENIPGLTTGNIGTIILKGDQGEDGDSAYTLAQSLGFSGSLEEWLASLVGMSSDEALAIFLSVATQGPGILSLPGELALTTGTTRFYIESEVKLDNVRASVSVPSTGAPIIVDILVNGVVRDSVSIPAGQQTATSTPSPTVILQPNDFITVNIVGIGSGDPGENLVVQLQFITTEVLSDSLQEALNIAKQGPALLTMPGVAFPASGSSRYYVDTACLIDSIRASVAIAPTGADIVLNIKVNDVTISVVTIADGTNMILDPSPGIVLDPEDYITIEIAQVGSVIPGADLAIQIQFTIPTQEKI